MIIVGAGIAGLLAARMLHRRSPVVVEAQEALPNNHSAVLRFRSSVVGDVTGIPFRRVAVLKGSVPWRNPVADALAYSRKTSRTIKSDRSIGGGATETVERWIAPPDFIQRLAEGTQIVYGQRHDFMGHARTSKEKVVSTIPMPDLAHALGFQTLSSAFLHVDGVNVTASIPNCDAFVSLYVPDPDLPFSRVSITGSQLIIELPGIRHLPQNSREAEEVVEQATLLLGIGQMPLEWEVKRQAYAKIVPIDEGERRSFIHWASTVAGVAFSLGRFATWRPGLLADDLVKDIRIIERLIDSRSPGYDAEKLERDRH